MIRGLCLRVGAASPEASGVFYEDVLGLRALGGGRYALPGGWLAVEPGLPAADLPVELQVTDLSVAVGALQAWGADVVLDGLRARLVDPSGNRIWLVEVP